MSRDLEWDGCVNVRDLGGLATDAGGATAFGAVVRADNVRVLTRAGWRAARDYGIRTIVDLRSAAEIDGDPPVEPSMHVVTLSLFDDFDGDASYRAELGRRLAGRDIREQYRTLYLEALERNAPRFAQALTAVARAAPGGVLVHCVGGKDRTGVLAALLLRLAGVSLDVVAADYTRSESRLGVPDSAPHGVIEPVLEILERRHGDVETYLRDAGAAEADVVAARTRLLGHPRAASQRSSAS